jgi:hypothetical protein
MAPSIHNTGVPLPKPPPNAHAVRAKPDITGIIFHVVSAAVMANGFLALLQLGMTEWINKQVSCCCVAVDWVELRVLIMFICTGWR